MTAIGAWRNSAKFPANLEKSDAGNRNHGRQIRMLEMIPKQLEETWIRAWQSPELTGHSIQSPPRTTRDRPTTNRRLQPVEISAFLARTPKRWALAAPHLPPNHQNCAETYRLDRSLEAGGAGGASKRRREGIEMRVSTPGEFLACGSDGERWGHRRRTAPSWHPPHRDGEWGDVITKRVEFEINIIIMMNSPREDSGVHTPRERGREREGSGRGWGRYRERRERPRCGRERIIIRSPASMTSERSKAISNAAARSTP